MRTIDLNADLGELEDGSLDAAVMPFITSCNIASGGHAGTTASIRRTIRLAREHGVAIGAHPGYPDRANFGRVSMELSTTDLGALVSGQVQTVRSIAEEEGARVVHVKLHGALYNDLAFDYDRSLAVAQTLQAIDPALRMIVFADSPAAQAAEDAGLVAIHEVFADRAYTDEGRLMPRSAPGAVFDAEADCLDQARRFVLREGGMTADSICVHGDHPSAVQFISNLRALFQDLRVTVARAGVLAFEVVPLGERSLLAQLPPRIAKSTHRSVRALEAVAKELPGVTEVVPCYAELKVDFDPQQTSFDDVAKGLRAADLNLTSVWNPRRIEVPVCYEGPDLARVAQLNGLTEAEVIRLHSEPSYLIYMLGFAPGFAYMGGLNKQLATPRLDTPRVSVPAGSVGIAGEQTGVYPLATPGGWNIIGRTPLNLFDPTAAHPFLFEPGDEVKFVPTDTALSAKPTRPDSRPVAAEGIHVLEPGMFTTVQDAGRVGYLRYGLPPSGAMDQPAFLQANALVGNHSDAAVLECTGTMPVLKCARTVKMAVVYADHFQTLEAAAGQAVHFQPLENGFRAYIAVDGGFDVPEVLGSRSTYVPGKLGGFEGRPLRAGDLLSVVNVDGASCSVVGEEHPLVQNGAGSSVYIRVIPGPEADWFDCGGLHTFLSEVFLVSSKSDRTGLRLDGAPLSFRRDQQMVSAGLAVGTIQVPPSGQPILMMADHPTTGGYPRIGHIVEQDLSLIAQLRPGDLVRFKEVR